MGHPFHKRASCASPGKISNEAYARLSKTAHHVWELATIGGQPIATRKVEENTRNALSSKLAIGDNVSLDIGGKDIVAKILGMDGERFELTGSDGNSYVAILDKESVAFGPEEVTDPRPTRPDTRQYFPERQVQKSQRVKDRGDMSRKKHTLLQSGELPALPAPTRPSDTRQDRAPLERRRFNPKPAPPPLERRDPGTPSRRQSARRQKPE